MISMLRIAALAAASLALAGCSSLGSTAATEREAASLARYEAAAGEPVGSFRFFRIDGYRVLGEHAVAVWTGPRQAYLVAVEEPCPGLRWSLAIGVTSSMSRVYADFDRVQTRDGSCRIRSIRPIDVAALRESEKAARQAPVEVVERES
ncbi:DUF6491 family protein [Silanimonas sp.]|jgi:hypothetical protein|uniref:DUF6491 family protein n=1 Tax=Silanimonas sp. TaxID=1929290 RepID=UPI0037CBCAE4